MNQFLGLLVNGLSLGCIYALIAIGFVVIFKSTRVLNFAHGSVVLFGAFVVGKTHEAVGFWAASLIGILSAAALDVLIDVVIMRKARAQGADPSTFAILTLGLNIVLLAELSHQLGSDMPSSGGPWGTSTVEFLGNALPVSRIAAAVTTIIVLTALWAVFKFSDFGIAMRAAAQDGSTAALMGIRLNRVAAAAWGLAGGIAALAGIFMTSFPSPGVSMTVASAALVAIPAWVLGGFDSVPGAVVGGLTIGVVSALAAGYQDHLEILGGDLGGIAPFAAMFVVLLIRPYGLFGTREATRV